jgi:hypothetical protein
MCRHARGVHHAVETTRHLVAVIDGMNAALHDLWCLLGALMQPGRAR